MAGKKKSKSTDLKGQALKDFRRNQAILYKKGLAKYGANKQAVTKYAIKKQKLFEPVISGNATVLKLDNKTAKLYKSKKLFEGFGTRVVVPKEQANETARIKRGLISVFTPLKNNEEERVILPVSVKDLPSLVRELKSGGEYEQMLNPGEAFGFRLFGHNATDTFPDLQDLINHIERNYKHLFDPSNSRQAYKHFVLVRFTGVLPEAPETEKFYTTRNRSQDEERPRSKSGAARRQKEYRNRTKQNKAAYEAQLVADRRRKAIKRERGYFE